MTGKITRSPRAPSFSLEDCVKNAVALYKDNGKHPIPADVAAKAMGYSGANNGSAARALASMKSFGLLISQNNGHVSVSPDVETYQYAPDEAHKRELLVQWLRQPKVYEELLNEYHDRLPSDQVVRFKMIKMGFLPSAAEDTLRTFRASLEFSDYYNQKELSKGSTQIQIEEAQDVLDTNISQSSTSIELSHQAISIPSLAPASTAPPHSAPYSASAAFLQPASGTDRILIRLSKGRRAWIEVPTPLFESDKAILKGQIDLIVTDDLED